MTDLSPAPDAGPIDPAVEAALDGVRATPAPRPSSSSARIPSVSALPGARARTWSGPRSGSPSGCARVGATDVEVERDGAPPHRLRADPRGARRADRRSSTATTTSSRWTRSSCGRRRPSSRSCATAGSSGRGVGRRQGPARDAPLGARGAARGRQGARRSTSPSCSRARRSTAPTASTPGSRPTGTAWRPTSRSSATRASSRATSRRSRSGLRGIMYAQIDVELSPVDLHSGMYGGTVDNPANALARIIAALKGAGRPGPDPGLLRRRRRPDRRRARGDGGAAVRRRGLPGRDPGAGARRRGGLDDARAQGRPPDARRQRHLGRLPGRGRQDDHPGPCPRQGLDAARGRTRTRRRSSRRCGTSWPRSPRRA